MIVDSIADEARRGRIRPGDSVGSENELARRFGVSRMTVRKALDVLAARGVIRRLAGKGTFLARTVSGTGVRSRRTGVLLCGLPYVMLSQVAENEFFAPIYEGAEAAAREAGYSLLFAPADLNHLEKPVTRRSCDGLAISFSDVPAKRLRTFARSGFPIVLMECDLGPEIPSVRADRFGGGIAIAEHLLSLGHRSFALVTSTGRPDGLEATGGHLAALARAGIEVPRELRAEGDFSYQSGAECAGKLLRSRRPFTAVLCANDSMARGAIDALNAKGLKVPKRVSVAGFEDLASAATHKPTLTTVHVDKKGMGRRAITRLVALVEGSQTQADKEVLPVRLVVRGSTAPPSQAASRRRGRGAGQGAAVSRVKRPG